MKRRGLNYTIVLILMLIFVSFQLPDSLSKKPLPIMVKARLEQDIREYYAERLKICKLDALTRAEDFVDSIIVNKISLTVLKGIRFPQKPLRPESPKDIQLDDTSKIKPVLR